MTQQRTLNNSPFIKTCGLTHASTVDCAAAYGARFVGFVFHHGHPQSISPERAAEITTTNISRVGVFLHQHGAEILPIMKQARLDYVQLHGVQGVDTAKLIGPQHIIRTIRLENLTVAQVQQQLDEWAPFCAFYLLEIPAGSGIGTGTDLADLDSLRFPHPWILSGDLHADNLPQVLQCCHPNGINLNSGIEIAPGMKCPSKMLAAFTAISHAHVASNEA